MRLINRHPDRSGRLLLILLPFALLLFAYFTGSAQRLAENPNDKLLPSASQMAAAVDRLAFTEDKRSGNYLFWQDTGASLERLAMGLGIAALAGGALALVDTLFHESDEATHPDDGVADLVGEALGIAEPAFKQQRKGGNEGMHGGVRLNSACGVTPVYPRRHSRGSGNLPWCVEGCFPLSR